MTCNQMILLLSICRGTEDSEFRVGTYENDLKHLQAEGYIKRSRDRNFMTPLANAWVRDVVLKDPQ